MTNWLTIMGMAFVTYLTRSLPILSMRGNPPAIVERFLRYVPPAIFAALVVPDLLLPTGKFELNALLWSGLLGVMIAFFTRNLAITLVSGLAIYALLRVVGIR